MADDKPAAKVSYPYMSAAQWYGIRAKFRQAMPSAVDADWVMAALGTTQRGASNVLPQLSGLAR